MKFKSGVGSKDINFVVYQLHNFLRVVLYHSTVTSLTFTHMYLPRPQGSNQKKIKEGWWFLDQSIFAVLTHSSDHIKENLLRKRGGGLPSFNALARTLQPIPNLRGRPPHCS